jgi:hypothetical protein
MFFTTSSAWPDACGLGWHDHADIDGFDAGCADLRASARCPRDRFLS